MARKPAVRPTHFRFVVLLLLACAATSAYMTRGLSAANTTIAREFQISDLAMGVVLAAFNLGYFCFQVPGGLVASRFGVRGALALMAFLWSACTLVGSVATTPDGLSNARVFLGIAQAGMVPCFAKVISEWFPLGRRGLTSAVITAAMQLGSIAASGLTATLLEPLGWRGTLQSYACVGVVWSGAFWLLFRDRPVDHFAVNEAERRLIEAGRVEPAATTDPDERPAVWPVVVRMLTSVTMWAFCAQAFFRAYAYELFSTWFPALLEKGYGASPEEAGRLATIPTTAILVGSLAAGVIVDRIFRLTNSVFWSRSGSAIVGMTLSGLSFLAALGVRDPKLLVIIISVGTLFSALGNPATWATAMDLGGRYTAVVVGVMNMVGTLGAYFCPKHVGALFDHITKQGDGRWHLVLWLFAAVNLPTAVLWVFVNPGKQSPMAE
ncbi:MAG: MFS transporter, partial [Planctomycetota bacterium]|nr:MFS transporter [Planctomycetota bacterium]